MFNDNGHEINDVDLPIDNVISLPDDFENQAKSYTNYVVIDPTEEDGDYHAILNDIFDGNTTESKFDNAKDPTEAESVSDNLRNWLMNFDPAADDGNNFLLFYTVLSFS